VLSGGEVDLADLAHPAVDPGAVLALAGNRRHGQVRAGRDAVEERVGDLDRAGSGQPERCQRLVVHPQPLAAHDQPAPDVGRCRLLQQQRPVAQRFASLGLVADDEVGDELRRTRRPAHAARAPGALGHRASVRERIGQVRDAHRLPARIGAQ
jgi:hypothetical protein